MTTRDIVVAGALPRQQVRSYLKALKLDWVEIVLEATVDSATVDGKRAFSADKVSFRVPDATEAQWGQIQEWVKKVTG